MIDALQHGLAIRGMAWYPAALLLVAQTWLMVRLLRRK